MRKIKFRAFQKSDSQMIEWESVRSNFWWYIDGYEDCELMQFTWLYDKNWKEIYEKSVIDNDYEVNFIFPWYILKNIYNGDIITFQNYEWQLQITKEYSEL